MKPLVVHTFDEFCNDVGCAEKIRFFLGQKKSFVEEASFVGKKEKFYGF